MKDGVIADFEITAGDSALLPPAAHNARRWSSRASS